MTARSDPSLVEDEPAEASDGALRPSKTQLKREMHALQALGAALAALPGDKLAALAMPEPLRDALREYQRTRSHEGRRRQMQYVGKLMRLADAGPLREAVASAQLGTAKASLALHVAERWRDELIADDAVLTAWMREHPDTDLPQLRQLIRQARSDAAAAASAGSAERRIDRKGRAYRELFKFVREHG